MKVKTVPKFKLIINWIVLFVSLIFLIFGLSTTYNNIKFYVLGSKIDATIIVVVDEEDEAYLEFRYEVDNIKYYGKAHNVDSAYNVNDSISIYYLNSNPEEYLLLSSSKWISYVFISVFLPLSIIYLIILIKYYKYTFKVKKLIKINKYFEATITDIITDDNNELYGIIPYTIICTFNDKTYKSKLIYDSIKDPRTIIGYNIKVYYENDFYFIDSDTIERK